MDQHSEAEPERESEARSDFSSEILRRLEEHSGGFGRYRIRGEVARGGQGSVLRVWDEDLQRNLAMKLVLGRGGDSAEDTPPLDSKALGRFLEEAQVTSQLDHPGIVPVHELGLDSEGRVYFTMKLVKGDTLKDVIDKVQRGEEGWTMTRALGVLHKVCEAMAYAHSKRVVHRDLKPANIMVGRFGEVYVMDWGLARPLDREDTKDIRLQGPPASQTGVHSERREFAAKAPDSSLVTMDGDVVGTPAYMPPEQAKGQLDQVGPASDVYSVGAMLYHLLAGHPPYAPRDAAVSPRTILAALLQGPPAPIAKIAQGPPEDLVAVCERAMAREPADRYQDIQQLRLELEALVGGKLTKVGKRHLRIATGVAVFITAIIGVGLIPEIKTGHDAKFAVTGLFIGVMVFGLVFARKWARYFLGGAALAYCLFGIGVVMFGGVEWGKVIEKVIITGLAAAVLLSPGYGRVLAKVKPIGH